MDAQPEHKGEHHEQRSKILNELLNRLRLKCAGTDLSSFASFAGGELEMREKSSEYITTWLEEGDRSAASLTQLEKRLRKIKIIGGRTKSSTLSRRLDDFSDADEWVEKFARILEQFRQYRFESFDDDRLGQLLRDYHEHLAKLPEGKGAHPRNCRPIFSVYPAGANKECIPEIKWDALQGLVGCGVIEQVDNPYETADPRWLSTEYIHWLRELRELGQLLVEHFDELPQSPDMYRVTAFARGVSTVRKQSADPLIQLLRSQRKVVLQGPPGTGKTYTAETMVVPGIASEEELGRTMPLTQFESLAVQARQEKRVVYEMVQFHASYDYEDFVRGYRARAGGEQGLGFELVDGPFARMATCAALYPNSRFVLIIDEINRADIARVLGECIYLLDRPVPAEDAADRLTAGGENAVRPRYVPAAGGEQNEDPTKRVYEYLCFPDNLYVVGTMNTADRSLAMLDMALRRRFAFVDVPPDWEVVESEMGEIEGLDDFLSSCEENFLTLNDELLAGKRGLQIGHSYFMSSSRDKFEAMREVSYKIRHQLLPLLEEYRQDGHFGGRTSEAEELIQKLSCLCGAA